MREMRPLRRWNDPPLSPGQRSAPGQSTPAPLASAPADPILLCDTETVGLPRDWSAPSSDFANWPRMVELAWRLIGTGGDTLAESASRVIPDGFTIPADAVRVHGITTEVAVATGRPLADVLAAFVGAYAQCSIIVAHNARFDRKVLEAEFLRMSMVVPWAEQGQKDRWRCSMVPATRMCCSPGSGKKWSFTSLEELYQHLFHRQPPEGLHSAAVDVGVLAECYLEMKRRGIAI